MPDSKITALTAITTVNPATFPLVIVDTSDTSMATTGTTKKVTTNQLLGSGGTATLASATITGDLTVDTSTLKVDSATNNVSIGGLVNKVTGVSGSGTGLTIQASAGPTLGLWDTTDPSYFTNLAQVDANCYLYNNAAGALLFGVGNVEAMRLNATGLGVGTSSIVNAAAGRGNVTIGGSSSAILNLSIGAVDTGYVIHDGTSIYLVNRIAAGSLIFSTNSTERFRIDPSGNVGIGVTPSAWGAGYKALQLGDGLSLMGSTINGTIAANAWFDGTNWKYISANSSAQYYCSYFGNGSHVWTTSTGVPSAGGTVSYNQAMTLDASGNLLVGKTAVGFGTVGVESSSSGLLVATRSASTDGASATMMVYSTGAAAYRFYVGMGGTVFATNTTISAISDARLKENVQDIDVGLGAILALKPRKFDWKEGKGKNIKGDRGFIAQEFEQVFPQLVDEWKDPAPEGEAPYKSVRQDLIPVLVKAIQELTARVQTLETR